MSEALLLPEEEIINLVTEYHFSGEENRHILAKNVAEAQLAHCFDEIEKIADMEGGHHTFKGKSVEDCILIPKAKWQAWKGERG